MTTAASSSSSTPALMDDTTSVATTDSKRSLSARYFAFVERRREHRRAKQHATTTTAYSQPNSTVSSSPRMNTSSMRSLQRQQQQQQQQQQDASELNSLTAALAFETPPQKPRSPPNNPATTTEPKSPSDTTTPQEEEDKTTPPQSSSPSSSSWLTRTRAFRRLCAHAFHMVDTDGSGDVDEQELYSGLLLVHLQLGMYLGPSACRPLSRARCHDVFTKLDRDLDGTLGPDEFEQVMSILCSNVLTRVLVQWSMTILLVPLMAKFLLQQFYALVEFIYLCIVNADEYSSVANALELTLEALGQRVWRALPASITNASDTLVQAWEAVPDSVWNAAPLALISTLLGILVVPAIIMQVDDCFQWWAERTSHQRGQQEQSKHETHFSAPRLALTGGTLVLIIYILLSTHLVPAAEATTSTSSSSASWQDSSNTNNVADASRHADLSPSMFAPGGRLYSVERVVPAANAPENPSNNLVAAVHCSEGVVVVATLPESPYLPRNLTHSAISTPSTAEEKDVQDTKPIALPLLVTPDTGIPRAPFARLSSTMWAVTAGNSVDSQLLRIKLHRLAETLRNEDQGDRADVLARRLADNLQVLTQQEGHGSILKAHAVIFTPKEMWRVDPTGQFWKCQGTVIGRGSAMAEAKMLAQLEESSSEEGQTNNEATDPKEKLKSLGRDEAIVLCKSTIVDTFASIEKKPIGDSTAVVPLAMKGISVMNGNIDWFSTEKLLAFPKKVDTEA